MSLYGVTTPRLPLEYEVYTTVDKIVLENIVNKKLLSLSL